MSEANQKSDKYQYFDDFNIFYEEETIHNRVFNVLIIGKTGVGKSTLVNAIFSEEFSRTGVGKPVTQNIVRHQKEGYPIAVYDTPGWEMIAENNQQLEKDVSILLSEDKIDIVWYCIHSGISRYEINEAEWIEEIAKTGVPIIIVLTQTLNPQHNSFLHYLEGQDIPVKKVIPILAQELRLTKDYAIEPYGLENLIKETSLLIKESVRRSFISAQIVDIEIKAREANNYVDTYIEKLISENFKELSLGNVNTYKNIITYLSEILAKVTFTFGQKPNMKDLLYLWNSTKEAILEATETGSLSIKLFNKEISRYKALIDLLRLISKIYINFYLNSNLSKNTSNKSQAELPSKDI